MVFGLGGCSLGFLIWGFLGGGNGSVVVVPDKEHFGEKQGTNQFWYLVFNISSMRTWTFCFPDRIHN